MIVVADTSGLIVAADRNAADQDAARRHLDEAGLVVVSPLVLAEVDHLAKARFGSAARSELVASIVQNALRDRFRIPRVTSALLDRAVWVQHRYAGLDLDLADAVNVVLAAEYHTDVVLTLDHRDFRAIKPLTGHAAFRLLPEDG